LNSEITGLAPATLITLLLTGLGPGARIRMKNGRTSTLPGFDVLTVRTLGAGVKRIVIELDPRELTDRTLRRLRQRAAQLSKSSSGPRPTKKQKRVVMLVREFGGPPAAKFDRKFWGRVAARLRI